MENRKWPVNRCDGSRLMSGELTYVSCGDTTSLPESPSPFETFVMPDEVIGEFNGEYSQINIFTRGGYSCTFELVRGTLSAIKISKQSRCLAAFGEYKEYKPYIVGQYLLVAIAEVGDYIVFEIRSVIW